jgi:hypothetical protein
MFKRLAFTFLLIVVLSQSAASTAYAMGEPAGGCAPGFTLEMAMEHDDHQHHHQHVGTDADKNGDGYICVQPVTPDGRIHVHVDNNVQ